VDGPQPADDQALEPDLHFLGVEGHIRILTFHGTVHAVPMQYNEFSRSP
jgi:hypothetical protein